MIGKSINHYKIIGELGEGGMGVVYRAIDTRLEREVALKFLSKRALRNKGNKERFIREAKSAAKLNHPNICTVHEINEFENQIFIAMELVEGETLNEKIEQGPLDIKEALDITIQIANGLKKAHDKGIIHRDIKSANVMITPDGVIKIMDFGLAKSDCLTKMTATGTSMGTASYMSPEQIKGEQVDGRTDIWALGVVIYEMLTGKLPFKGEYSQAVIYSILNEKQADLAKERKDIPKDLEDIVDKALEKRRENRFGSAKELCSKLEKLRERLITDEIVYKKQERTGGKQPILKRFPISITVSLSILILAAMVYFVIIKKSDKPSGTGLIPNRIVVALFDNLSGDTSLEPIGRIASDWITNQILQNEKIEVVPSISVIDLLKTAEKKNDSLTSFDVAEYFGAAILLDGTYFVQGDEIVINARMLDVSKKEVIRSFQPESGSKDEPVKVINLLGNRVSGELMRRTRLKSTYSFGTAPKYKAMVEFLNGLQSFAVDYRKSFYHFERSIEADPEFYRPYLFLAAGYTNIGRYEKAEELLLYLDRNKGKLDPFTQNTTDLFIADLKGERLKALEHARKSAEMDPNSFITNYILIVESYEANYLKEAIDAYNKFDKRFLPVDKFYAISWRYYVVSSCHYLLGQYDKEVAVLDEGIKLFPDNANLLSSKAAALVAGGDIDALKKLIQNARGTQFTFGSTLDIIDNAAWELRIQGYRDEASEMFRALIKESESRKGDEGMDTDLYLSSAYYGLGKWQEAEIYINKKLQAEPKSIELNCILGIVKAYQGKRDEAISISNELGKQKGKYLHGENIFAQARIAAATGEYKKSIELLQKAIQLGYAFGVWEKREFTLLPLHKYPEYQALIKPKE